MSKKITYDDFYTDAPPEVDEAFERAIKVSDDFLPPPSEMAKMKRKKSVTIRLDSNNIDFFKREAEANGVHYQTMINNLLSRYVAQHSHVR
jgi:predicted DNA binding CopG/RHH family protein